MPGDETRNDLGAIKDDEDARSRYAALLERTGMAHEEAVAMAKEAFPVFEGKSGRTKTSTL